jgi:hypothetical protein
MGDAVAEAWEGGGLTDGRLSEDPVVRQHALGLGFRHPF